MTCRTEASATLIVVVSKVLDGHLQDGCRRQREG
jgi:hypothetical protein